MAPANAYLADAARLTGVNAARELRYTTDSPLPADATNRGLLNLGNTCYGNALLFALSKIPRVRRWLHEHVTAAVKPPIHGPRCPLCMLARDMEHLARTGTQLAHTPEVLIHRRTWNPNFNNTNQQDAHEAFQTLLGSCDDVDASAMYALPACRNMTPEEFQASAYRATTPHNQIFGNLQLVRTKCTACNIASVQYERAHAHDLSLAKEEHSTLDVLFADHFGADALDASFRCGSCNTCGQGEKSTEVLHWPPVLAISFKRFVFDRRTRSMEKINRPIGYPLLFPIRAGVTYHLRAVVVHSGTARIGHYTAYVRGDGDRWFYCNDTAVPRRIANPMEVVQQQAYMLFYER